MRIKGTECNGCPECIGCWRRHSDYYYHECDRCGCTEKLYKYDGEELCAECLLEEFEEVDMEE